MMTRITAALGAIFLVSACAGSGSSPAQPTPVASPVETLSPADCPGGFCHFDTGIMSFDYPSSWHAASYNVVSSFSNDLVYLSTAPLSDPCDRGPSSVSCSRLAATALGTNGVLVTWTAWGFPGWSFDPNEGSQLSVGQREATLVTQAAEDGCQKIGGVREMIVKIPRSAESNWMQLDACFAGPDPSAAQSQVEAMLKTVHWTEQ
jgi:hypothetical protein